MKTVHIAEFCSSPESYLQQVEDNQDILKIFKPKKNEGFIIMTRNEYESFVETVHLLSTPANAHWLMESIAQHQSGKTTTRKLITRRLSKKVK